MNHPRGEERQESTLAGAIRRDIWGEELFHVGGDIDDANVYTSASSVVLSRSGAVAYSIPGITAALGSSNSASPLHPQCHTYSDHNLPLPVNNVGTSDIQPNRFRTPSVDVSEALSVHWGGQDLPNETCDSRNSQSLRLRDRIANSRNIGNQVVDHHASGGIGVANTGMLRAEYEDSMAWEGMAGGWSGSMPNGNVAGGDMARGSIAVSGQRGFGFAGYSVPYGGGFAGGGGAHGGVAHGGVATSVYAGGGLAHGGGVMVVSESMAGNSIAGAMYNDPLLSQACGPAEKVSNIRTREELAQEYQMEAAQQHFSMLPSYGTTGDIVDGALDSYRGPLPSTSFQNSRPGPLCSTSTAVTCTAGHVQGSGSTDAHPIVTGHSGHYTGMGVASCHGYLQQDLGTFLNGSVVSQPGLGLNSEDVDNSTLNPSLGLKDELSICDEFLNSPSRVQELEQIASGQYQQILAATDGIEAERHVLYGCGPDVESSPLDPASCSERGDEVGGANASWCNKRDETNDAGSTFQLTSSATLAEATGGIQQVGKLSSKALGSHSDGSSFHDIEKTQALAQHGYRLGCLADAQQQQRVGSQTPMLQSPESSNVIEDSLSMVRIMAKGQQATLPRHLDNQGHVGFCVTTEKSSAANQPFEPLVATSIEEDPDLPLPSEDPDLASICDQFSLLPLPEDDSSTVAPSPADPTCAAPINTDNLNKDIDYTPASGCSPVSLSAADSVDMSSANDVDSHRSSAHESSNATLCPFEKTEFYQTSTYLTTNEQISEIAVRSDIPRARRELACGALRFLSEYFLKCKDCVDRCQRLNLEIAINKSAKLCKTHFDLDRMVIKIHLPLNCVGVTDWLQAHDAGVDPPDRQLVVHQVFVLLAIVHGLGFEDKLSLWGSFTVWIGRENQAYVKMEFMDVLTKMALVQQDGQYDSRVGDVEAVQQLFRKAMEPFLGPDSLVSAEIWSLFDTIGHLMSDSSCASRMADLVRVFGQRRFCQLMVEVGGNLYSTVCLEGEPLLEATRKIQSMLPIVDSKTWQLQFVEQNSPVSSMNVAVAHCCIHLQLVLVGY